jgi:hypothetical protein
MRRMIQGAALGVACSVLMMASLGGDTGLASSSRQFTEVSPVNNVADVINTIGTQTYLSSFAGVRVDDSRNITVFLASQNSGFLSRIKATAGSQIHVNYVVAHHSLQQLIALEQDIAIRDRDVLMHDGVNVGAVFPDVSSNGLVVTLLTPSSSLPVSRDVASARGILQSRYGNSMLTVSNSTMLPSTSVTRYNDSPPFYGGDQITYGGYGCTSGFSVYSSSLKKDGVLAAGHCFPTGASVRINCVSPAPSCAYCCDTVGPVGPRWYPPNGVEYDAEVIWASSVGWVWGGSPSSPILRMVYGTLDPVEGTYMSIDGSYTGERTGLLVTEFTGCVEVTYGSTAYPVCGVGSASGSSPPCKGGDSGGPAYVPSGSSVKASGIIISVLGNTCYFTEILVAESKLGVTVING